MIDLSKYTKELSKLFSSSGNILIICHINPDGDSVGAQLALYHYFKVKKCIKIKGFPDLVDVDYGDFRDDY